MSATKRITNGDYNIKTVTVSNVGDVSTNNNVIVTTNTLRVDGNLELTGNLNHIGNINDISYDYVNFYVQDKFITLGADSNTAADTSTMPGRNYYGIIANVGATDTALVWSANTGANIGPAWQITTDIADANAYSNIATESYVDNALSVALPPGDQYDMLFFTDANALANTAGNLRWDGANLTIKSNVTVNGNVTLTTNTAGAGGTGIYFTEHTSGTQDELISRRKAFIFSLIF